MLYIIYVSLIGEIEICSLVLNQDSESPSASPQTTSWASPPEVTSEDLLTTCLDHDLIVAHGVDRFTCLELRPVGFWVESSLLLHKALGTRGVGVESPRKAQGELGEELPQALQHRPKCISDNRKDVEFQ